MRVTWLDVLLVLTFAFAAYRMPARAHGPPAAAATVAAAGAAAAGPRNRHAR